MPRLIPPTPTKRTGVVVQRDARAGREDEDADVEVVLLDHAEVVDFGRGARGRLHVRVHGARHAQVVEFDLRGRGCGGQWGWGGCVYRRAALP